MTSLSIQAGGQSRRMGRDKALLDFLGQPLILRVLTRLSHLSDDIFITANHPEKFPFLDVPVLPDIVPGVGPLGGIFTALKTAQYPVVFLIACDLPFVNPALLKACQEILMKTGVDAVIPQSENGLEPLHAVYHRDTCLPLVEEALNAGKRRLISWHTDAKIHVLTTEEVAKYDPHGITFWNINTPEEYQQAQEKAREFGSVGIS